MVVCIIFYCHLIKGELKRKQKKIAKIILFILLIVIFGTLPIHMSYALTAKEKEIDVSVDIAPEHFLK